MPTAKPLLLIVLALACNGSDDSDIPEAAPAHVCEGDHFAGDAPTQAELAECTRITGSLIFTGNELLHVELPKLRNVDGNFTVWGNPKLTDVKLSQLVRVGGYFLIEANETLTRVDFPVLESVNEQHIMHLADCSISGNPQLPTCQAHALRDQLQAHDFAGSFKVGDNLGTCPE